MDIGKINQELGWTPRESLESGLRQTVAWYLNNTDWIEAIVEEKDYHRWIERNYERRGEAT
jgi:dTDP-glucose 4,6-dehydratase